ncbi:Mating-type alpha-pheromone receptor [Lasiodiplodia theobromae]|uniref:Mating-type alpha-pheromone receptor n=1 Tax=Lasiodiplodia theobromae TaxID=45133 RepID=UPI0015C2D658|nr:Mating-type alpha-pheromone receptor [Lasiodiplodia theobromae]KAF4544781.1 Mating-type alpha-pheromone receptor [Lasiodiplodia theobromae]
MSPIPSAGPASNETIYYKHAANAPPFDPWNQTIVLYDAQGYRVPHDLRLNYFNDWAKYAIHASINWGSQIGASIIMVILLLVLTKHDKRRSPIFILNILALVLSVVRAITNVAFYTSEFYNFYTFITEDVSRVPTSDYATSITAVIMTLLLLTCIELSLILQASVVCATLARPRRITITVLSIVVALMAIGARIALTVWNIQFIFGLTDDLRANLPAISNITSSFSVCFFSLIFCGKLGLAIRNRRKLGLKQFGPMQIVFIMAAQTLIIPGICSMVQFFTNDEIGALSLTVVAIFLPLSSVWAAANTDSLNQASRSHDAHHKFLGGLKWKKAPGERKSIATTLDSSILSSRDPLSPSSRKTTSTDDTEKTHGDVEDDRDDQVFEAGKAINRMFP